MTPTFILDGIFGRVRRFRGLRDKIRNHVGPCDFWDYENTGRTCLWELGRQLASHLKQVGPCHLVAYSMGGWWSGRPCTSNRTARSGKSCS
jgi:pimeloyl-ACP methyl ester carboxylesterase